MQLYGDLLLTHVSVDYTLCLRNSGVSEGNTGHVCCVWWLTRSSVGWHVRPAHLVAAALLPHDGLGFDTKCTQSALSEPIQLPAMLC